MVKEWWKLRVKVSAAPNQPNSSWKVKSVGVKTSNQEIQSNPIQSNPIQWSQRWKGGPNRWHRCDHVETWRWPGVHPFNGHRSTGQRHSQTGWTGVVSFQNNPHLRRWKCAAATPPAHLDHASCVMGHPSSIIRDPFIILGCRFRKIVLIGTGLVSLWLVAKWVALLRYRLITKHGWSAACAWHHSAERKSSHSLVNRKSLIELLIDDRKSRLPLWFRTRPGQRSSTSQESMHKNPCIKNPSWSYWYPK